MTQAKLERKLRFLIRTLPIVFLLHNIEEAFTMEQWSYSTPVSTINPVTTEQFMVAIAIFSLFGFIIVYGKKLYKSERVYDYVIAGFSGMLFLNVFIPHLIGAIYLGTYTPGLITGVLLNLPLSLSILKLLAQLQKLNIRQIIPSVVIGGITGALLAYLFLETGKAILH